MARAPQIPGIVLATLLGPYKGRQLIVDMGQYQSSMY